MSIHSKKDRSLLILFSVIVIDLIGFGIVVPILPFYAVQYGASAAVLGWILTSYSAMQFLFAPLWGRLSDRIGRKPVMVLTIGGVSIGLIVLGTADSLLMIFLGRILSGIFSANISVASAYLSDVTSEEDRAYGMGLLGAAFGVGFILGPAIGGGLSSWGYHVPILMAAVLAAINMLYASLRLREPERHEAHGDEIKPTVLKQPVIFKMCLLYFLFTLGINQLESMFAFFMMDRFGYDAREVAWILVGMGLIMVAIQGGAIRPLARRFGEKTLLIFGSFILASALFFVPWPHQVGLLLIPLLLSSVGRGLSQPSMMSLVSKRASPQMRGAVMGTFQSSASLGRVVGPLVAGFLYDHWQTSPFYFAAFLIFLVFIASTNL